MDKETVLQMVREMKNCQKRVKYLMENIVQALDKSPNLSRDDVIEIMNELGYVPVSSNQSLRLANSQMKK